MHPQTPTRHLWHPQPVVYPPGPLPGAKYGMSRSLRSRARMAGALSALFGQLGMLLFVGGGTVAGFLGLNWLATLTDDTVPIDDWSQVTAGWGMVLIAVGIVLMMAGTLSGQLFAAACRIHRAGGTAWWGSTVFNIVQILAYLTGVIFILPVLAPLVVLAFGLPEDTVMLLYLLGMVAGLLVNSMIGMWISGLLWQWTAWAHRPTVGAAS